MASSERSGRGVRSAEKEQFWRGQVEGQAASGMTVRAWCQRERISEPSFYSWRRELARRTPVVSVSRPTQRKPLATGRRASSDAGPESADFLPIRLTAAAASSVELELPSGLVIRVPAHETAALRTILEVVEPRPC